MGTRTLRINNNAELLSYMINTVPELSDIDLPVEGESTAKYGELIMNCDRYKNAFINTINLIGLTLVKRNEWENPDTKEEFIKYMLVLLMMLMFQLMFKKSQIILKEHQSSTL